MHILLFACFLLLTVPPCVGRAVGPVTSVSNLVGALRDSSVDQISLASGVFNLDAASGGLVIGPNRQVELVGSINVVKSPNSQGGNGSQLQPAFHYASGIDFGSNSQGLFRLGDNTTLVFRNLFLWNGLSQLGYDWQVVTLAQPGARASVRFFQTVKLRDGCLPLQIFVQHVNSYTRLQDADGGQTASLLPFCFVPPAGAPPAATVAAGTAVAFSSDSSNSGSTGNGTCLAETLAIDNLATNITRSNGQSYKLYEQSSTYWCLAYASMSCLSASGPEQCVKELLEGPKGSSARTGSATDGGNNGSNNPTNILVPAIITGVLVLAFVFAAVWCLHRRGVARRGSSLAAHPGAGDGGGDVEAGAGRGVGARVGDALARLLPGAAARDAHRKKPYVPGYVPVVSKEALDRIAKVRAELSSKMVVASSSDDLSDVRNLHMVGKGTFGRVYKGEWKGVTVALKVISVPVSQYGQAQWQQVLGEAAISTLLNHPCVLQTYSVALLEYSPALKPVSAASEDGAAGANNNEVSSSKGEANSGEQQPPPPPPPPAVLASGAHLDDMAPFYQLKMVSEFCEGGSVVQALRRMHFYDSVGGGAVRLPAVVDIAAQVASGMAYLHSANIIHADLKAANVLLKQQPGSGRLQAKVADFGLSFRLEEPEATHVTKGQLGSITHMAPEVLVHGRVSKSSDVYSFGILLYELYTGQQAYWDVPQPMLAYHVATSGGRPLLPPHCPAAYRGLAKACWTSEPGARPTFDEVYKGLQALAEEVSRGGNTNNTNNSRGGISDAAECDTAPNRDGRGRGLPPPRHQAGQPMAAAAAAAAAQATAAMGAGQLLLGAAAPSGAGALGYTTCGDGRVAPPPSYELTPAVSSGASGRLTRMDGRCVRDGAAARPPVAAAAAASAAAGDMDGRGDGVATAQSGSGTAAVAAMAVAEAAAAGQQQQQQAPFGSSEDGRSAALISAALEAALLPGPS